MDFYKTTYKSPVGLLTLASDGEHLIGLWLDGQKYHGQSVPGALIEQGDLTVFDRTKEWLDRYFAGKKPQISELPIAPIGTPFRKAVWQILCDIPYGAVVTYGHVARCLTDDELKARKLSRAVGGAVGHNPISIIVPCHRVVGSNGKLTGYAGGLERKQFLLELEKDE
ncbi:MAG: methylated-DNA--[protein]-cysteine S-methyltransferase [Oscillospiraceae bacterium]|nr:methylated-DNA--[protein]-cysteine S-methyltransferase [Oscillospiraceae bacterium]